MCHCSLQVRFGDGPHSYWIIKALRFLAFGHYCVDVFIVLSGFCLAMPVVRGNGQLQGGAINFFRRRARRILPPYYLAFGLSLLLIYFAIGHGTPGTNWGYSLPITLKSILAHLLLIQDAFTHTKSNINYALWSVSVEWRIYFVFPLLIILRRRWGSLTVAVAATVLSYLIIYVIKNTVLNSHVSLEIGGVTPQFLGLFAMGLMGADIAYGQKALFPLLRHPAYAMALLVVTTLVMVVLSEIKFLNNDVLPIEYTDAFVGLWAMSILVAAANSKVRWLDKALSWRPLVFIGSFAYSIYLIHAPLIQVLWQYVFIPLQSHASAMFVALCLVGTPLIVSVSYLFFLCCERPFLNRRKRETTAQTERDVALSPAP